MCAAWRMAEYLRTSSMENLALANDPVAAHSWGTRTCANEIWEPWKSIPRAGKTLRQTPAAGVASSIRNSVKEGEEKITNEAIEKRTSRKEKTTTDSAASTHICYSCGKDCHSRIGRISHRRHFFRARQYELTVIGHSFHDRGRPKEAYY